MNAINKSSVNTAMESFLNREVYLHLETTNGAYAVPKGQLELQRYYRNQITPLLKMLSHTQKGID